jgi:Uma2 family endonuclease
MSTVPHRRLTAAEYLAHERQAPTRSEFHNGELFAMAGASYAHTVITDNLVTALGNALRDSGCRTLSRDMRVKVNATGLYTYPDLIIVCGSPELEDHHGDTLFNPRVLVEVLSDSTELYDRTVKFQQYQAIPSFMEYLLVSQTHAVVERFTRNENASWERTEILGAEASVTLDSVPATVRLADIYEGVPLHPTPEPSPSSTLPDRPA